MFMSAILKLNASLFRRLPLHSGHTTSVSNDSAHLREELEGLSEYQRRIACYRKLNAIIDEFNGVLIKVLDDTGHNSFIEKPQETADIITDFIG